MLIYILFNVILENCIVIVMNFQNVKLIKSLLFLAKKAARVPQDNDIMKLTKT